MLAADNVSYLRQDTPIIEQFSYQFQPKKCYAILGANGSGKTTLLKLLAGLLEPASGSVQRQENHTVHYLGHKLALPIHRDVYDTLAAWANYAGTETAIEAAMTFMGLVAHMDTPIGSLSAGWQKRVALTKCLLIPRPIWLLDEPFANLDEGALTLLQQLITARLEQEAVVIFTAHQPPNWQPVTVIKL
jgi:heme exporter protein A